MKPAHLHGRSKSSTRPKPRWGFVIDLSKCLGCECCTVNCQQVHDLLPGQAWRKVSGTQKTFDATIRQIFLSMACMHCANPPCLEVCPTGATFQHPEGIVDIRPDRCMGCGYCVVACPYQARTIQHVKPPIASPPSASSADNHHASPDPGTCTKCNLCWPRLEAAAERGHAPGSHPDATPVCVNSCLAGALAFGDLADPESEVSRRLRKYEAARLHEYLGTDPAVYFIWGA